MVKEINFEGKIAFVCEKCGWMYRDLNKAEECQDYCKKHNACSLELTKYAIKV
jgi:hypothetical protein